MDVHIQVEFPSKMKPIIKYRSLSIHSKRNVVNLVISKLALIKDKPIYEKYQDH